MTSVNKMAKQAKKADKRREAHIEAQRQTGEFTPAQLLMQQEIGLAEAQRKLHESADVYPEPRTLRDVMDEFFGEPVSTSMMEVVARAHEVTPVSLKLSVKEWGEVQQLMVAAAQIALDVSYEATLPTAEEIAERIAEPLGQSSLGPVFPVNSEQLTPHLIHAVRVARGEEPL